MGFNMIFGPWEKVNNINHFDDINYCFRPTPLLISMFENISRIRFSRKNYYIVYNHIGSIVRITFSSLKDAKSAQDKFLIENGHLLIDDPARFSKLKLLV
jgi:hypothetical protein